MTTVSIWTKRWYCGNQSSCISIEEHLNGNWRAMEFIVYVLQYKRFVCISNLLSLTARFPCCQISIDFMRSKSDSQTIFTVNQSRFDQYQLQIQICYHSNWTRDNGNEQPTYIDIILCYSTKIRSCSVMMSSTWSPEKYLPKEKCCSVSLQMEQNDPEKILTLSAYFTQATEATCCKFFESNRYTK